ncbi:tyrosine/serine/threonine protein phosphatase pps1, partial [Steccherinum ochraceum]
MPPSSLDLSQPPALDSTALTSQPGPDHVHGLSYDPDFLASLPTLNLQYASPPSTASSSSSQGGSVHTSPSPSPHSPIRRLTAPQFGSIHLKYVTTHAPDHVLFPFLHGLEGDNEAQNQFFASAGTVCLPHQLENPQTGTVPYVPQVPKYRGLVWVAADDAQAASAHTRAYDPELYAYMDTLYPDSEIDDAYSTSSNSTTSDDDDFDDADVASVEGQDPGAYLGGVREVPMDLDLDMEMEMDVDVTINGERGIAGLRGNEGEHMHPVKDRSKAPASTPLTVSPTPTSPAARTPSLTPSTPSSLVSASTESSHASPSAPSGTAFPPIPLSPPPLPPTPQSYPVLTSSFRPRDLVRESLKGLDLGASPQLGYEGMGGVERFGGGAHGNGNAGNGHLKGSGECSGEWEFVEPKVPDGISLRNFGIQAPIYATISDIVVYSPQGNTAASIALAQKFKQAIEKKYAQRLERLRSVSPSPNQDAGLGLVKYNVFVLDATPDEMHAHLEHLVSRVEDVTRVPQSHTDGTDAHAHGDVSPDVGSPPSVYDDEGAQATPGYDQAEQGYFAGEKKVKKEQGEKQARVKTLRANTINFAQREKDEMRDLTRASEIVTFFPPASPAPTPRPAHAMDDAEKEKEKDREEISGSSTATFWDPTLGQIYLGNSNDVPIPVDDPLYSRRAARHTAPGHSGHSTDSGSEACSCSCADEEEWDWSGNDPAQGFGYDICIECDDLAPFPTMSQMKKAEEHIRAMEKAWVERCLRRYEHQPFAPTTPSSEEEPPGEEM